MRLITNNLIRKMKAFDISKKLVTKNMQIYENMQICETFEKTTRSFISIWNVFVILKYLKKKRQELSKFWNSTFFNNSTKLLLHSYRQKTLYRWEEAIAYVMSSSFLFFLHSSNPSKRIQWWIETEMKISQSPWKFKCIGKNKKW